MNFFKNYKKAIYCFGFIFIIIGVIINHEIKKNASNLILDDSKKKQEKLDIPTKTQIQEKLDIIEKLQNDLISLEQEYQIKKDNSHQYYDPSNDLEFNLKYLESKKHYCKEQLLDLKKNFNNLGINIFNGEFSPTILDICIQDLRKNNFYEERINECAKTITKIKIKLQNIVLKIKITRSKYDKIKSYILSEDENEILSLNDLSKEEIRVIKNGKKWNKKNLEDKREDKAVIDRIQEKCNNLKNKIKLLGPLNEKNEIEIKELNNMLSKEIKIRDLLQLKYNNKKNIYGDPLESFNSLYEII